MDYLSTNFIKYQTQQKAHPSRRLWTKPLEPKQLSDPSDADPIKDRLRPRNLQYHPNRPVNDRRPRNKHQTPSEKRLAM